MENLVFFFDAMGHNEYCEYIYELLMLIEMLCKNEDHSAIKYVKKELNFKPQILVKIATSRTIHILYRKAGHRLFMTTCVCPMQGRCSFMRHRFADMCFKTSEIKDPEI